MDLAACVACGAPVLELEGQFDKLDSYFISDGSPPGESAGWWHLSCLRASDVGPAWQAARLRNYRDVRKLTVVAEPPGWVVLGDARGKRLAIGATGELVDLSIARGRVLRKVDDGVVFARVDDGFYVELAHSFEPSTEYPLSALLVSLGTADRVVDPIALEGGTFRFDRRGASARLEYGVFIPRALLQ
jgi:hypothetical protein